MPKAVAFDGDLEKVIIIPDGARCIIASADAAWDDFFAAPGIGLFLRYQPAMQERDSF